MSNLTFILIPGAGGDPWYWHLVTPKLEANGYQTIAVELPTCDDKAGLTEYTNAALKAIGKRDPQNLIVIAQSLGGFVAPLLCERLPVRALVLVNAMIPNPGERPGEWFAKTRQAEAKREKNVRDGRAADAPFDPLLDFFHDVPQPVIDEAWARGEPKQSDNVFGSPCTFKAWPTCPTLVLTGSDDRFFPAEFQKHIARERLGLEAELLPGGHLIALSRPDELAARLVKCARSN